MICCSCKVDRLVNDFINSENICYRCMYRLKLQKAPKTRAPKRTLCRTCGEEIVIKKDLKKPQRTVFCSKACAENGHKHQLKNHWTKRISNIYCRKEIDLIGNLKKLKG